MDNQPLSTSSNSSLNNLPDICYFHVLNNLDLSDVWNLRLVSKQFYMIVNGFKIAELSFVDYNHYKTDWFTTTRTIKLGNRFDVSRIGLLSNPSSNFINLKYLKIRDTEYLKNTPIFDFEWINKFTKLRILELSCKTTGNFMQLPNLKAFSIQFDFTNNSCLTIDTPMLHSLCINGYHLRASTDDNFNPTFDELIQIKNPQSVKFLKVVDYDASAAVFSNLECLEIDEWYDDELIRKDLLAYKKLKKLRINKRCWNGIRSLKRLFSSKKDNLEMVVEGVTIYDVELLDELINDFNFKICYYDDLEDNLSMVGTIFANALNTLLSIEPSDLFVKFSSVHFLELNGIQLEENQLIQLARRFPNLSTLRFNSDSKFSQAFYDQLSNVCSIIWIELFQTNISNKFINNMHYLSYLRIHYDLVDANLRLNDLKYLKKIEIRRNPHVVSIKKHGKDKYQLVQLSTAYRGNLLNERYFISGDKKWKFPAFFYEYFSLDNLLKFIDNFFSEYNFYQLLAYHNNDTFPSIRRNPNNFIVFGRFKADRFPN